MQISFAKWALVGAVLIMPTAAFGLDWTQADSLFARRGSGRAVVAEARQAYVALLGQATIPADKLRAASQLGRLAIYEGEMLLPRTASSERRQIFGQCWCSDPRVAGLPPRGTCASPGFIDKISPANLGETHPAYYYFHGVCLSLWSEQASLGERIAFSSAIKADIDSGLTTDTRFEGGGIKRLQAGVQSNPATKALGFFSIATALSAIDDATSSEPYPGDPLAGSQYFENWSMKIKVLLQAHEEEPNGGWRDQALDLLVDKLNEMDEKIADDVLPVGRAPEFLQTYAVMKERYRTITGSDWNP